MRVQQQIRRPELLQQLTISAQSAHIRLALTPESAQSDDWIARSVIVDVFPQAWLDNPSDLLTDNSATQYRPPKFLHEYPGQALFFADFVPTQQITNWLTRSEACELSQFDKRQGHGSRVKRFSLPELQDEVFGTRVFSGKPDGFVKLPWPRNVYRYNLRNANSYRDGDYATLYAMGQPHFDNLREARAKLVHGYINGSPNYQDTDTITVRFIDGDGWIRAARFSDTQVDVTVGGLKIFSGRVILKGDGMADDEQQFMGSQTISFNLHAAPPPNLNIILANDREELDRAWRTQWPSPFDPPAPHVLDLVNTGDVSALTIPQIAAQAVETSLPDYSSNEEDANGKSEDRAKQRRTRTLRKAQSALPSSTTVRVLRVIVASPGDVAKERECVPRVLNELNRNLARQFGLRLEPWEWETDTYPDFHADGPQGQVDKSMDVETADIVVGIFWKRFGTPVGDAKSGTEHELRRALASWKQTGYPHVMIYFNDQAFRPRNTAEIDQLRAVYEFRDEISSEGLFWTYKGSGKFESLLRQHLQQLMSDYYGNQPGNAVTSADERSVSINAVIVTRTEATSPAQIILRYLVLHYEPESAVTASAVTNATGLQGRDLMDALHDLGDAGIIKPLGNAAHLNASFKILITAWELVEPDVLGFSVQEDMLRVADVASEHDSIDRDELLRATGLPEHRLDIAALLLNAHGNLNLYRPLVRGLTFRSALPDYKTRRFISDHRK